MEFIKKIRNRLGLNQYQAQKILGFTSTRGYIDFEDSKRAVNLEKLVKLWRISEMSGDDFLEMIETEVIGKTTLTKKNLSKSNKV